MAWRFSGCVLALLGGLAAATSCRETRTRIVMLPPDSLGGTSGSGVGGAGAGLGGDSDGGTSGSRASGGTGQTEDGGDAGHAGDRGDAGHAGDRGDAGHAGDRGDAGHAGDGGRGGEAGDGGFGADGAGGSPEPPGPGWDSVSERYVFEGDILFRSSDDFLSWAAGNADATWQAPEKRRLSYCVSSAFGTSNHPVVLRAMQIATAAWENVADVRFVHRPEEDETCDADNDDVVFDVVPAPDTATFEVAGFFPSFARRDRELRINFAKTLLSRRSLPGLLRHMLGHALGRRHEYLNARAQTDACETGMAWEVFTFGVPVSVMHYPWCRATSHDFVISRRDAENITLVYDAPTNVVVLGTSVFMRRPGNGNFFRYSGGGEWTRISGPARHFVSDGSELYRLPRDGLTIDRYTGSDTTWEPVGAGGGQLLACLGQLCATHDVVGTLFRYTLETDRWDQISPAMRSWSSSKTAFYALADSAPFIYQYYPQSWNYVANDAIDVVAGESGFWKIDANFEKILYVSPVYYETIGDAGAQLVRCGGSVCRLSLDRTATERYVPRAGSEDDWQDLGRPAARLYEAPGGLYAVDPETFDLWWLPDGATSWVSLRQP